MVKYRSGLFFGIGFLLFGVFMSGSVLACAPAANVTIGKQKQRGEVAVSSRMKATCKKYGMHTGNDVKTKTNRVTSVDLNSMTDVAKNKSVSSTGARMPSPQNKGTPASSAVDSGNAINPLGKLP